MYVIGKLEMLALQRIFGSLLFTEIPHFQNKSFEYTEIMRIDLISYFKLLFLVLVKQMFLRVRKKVPFLE